MSPDPQLGTCERRHNFPPHRGRHVESPECWAWRPVSVVPREPVGDMVTVSAEDLRLVLDGPPFTVSMFGVSGRFDAARRLRAVLDAPSEPPADDELRDDVHGAVWRSLSPWASSATAEQEDAADAWRDEVADAATDAVLTAIADRRVAPSEPEGPPSPSLPDPPDLVALHYQREQETIIRTLGEGCTCRPDDGSTDPFGPDGCHRAALCMLEHEDRVRRERLDRACELLQVARDTFRVYQHSGGPVDSAIAAFLTASRPDVAPRKDAP